MEGIIHISDVDIKIFFNFFYTPGTEIAPGSNKIRENFKKHVILAFLIDLKHAETI